MTAHMHGSIVPGCYRCDLNRDEVEAAIREGAEQAAREEACPDHQWQEMHSVLGIMGRVHQLRTRGGPMSARPLPPGWTKPREAAPPVTPGSDSAWCDCVSNGGTPHHAGSYGCASVTPGSDQLRDKPGRTHADSQIECDLAEVLHTHPAVVWADALALANALMSGPLASLIAERDRYAAQVQRVRDALNGAPLVPQPEIRRALEDS